MTDQTPPAPADNGGTDPWYSNIADPTIRGKAELKGWKTPDDALSSYFNLESKMGAPPDELWRIPSNPDDPLRREAIARLGFAAPDKPEDYELSVPEGFSDDYAKTIAQVAKDANVPKHMLKALQDATNTYSKSAMEAAEKADALRQTDALASLRADWGGSYDSTMALAQRAEETVMREAGLSQESVDAWRSADPQGYYKLQAYFGSKMGEARRVDGDAPPNQQAMSPEAAKAQLKARMADADWFQRWEKGGSEEISEFKRLNRILRESSQ